MLKKIEILTIFPHFFDSYLQQSLVGKALQKKLFSVLVQDLRLFTQNKHKRVDDSPYGGGAGMVLSPAPLAAAIQDYKQREAGGRLIYLTPQGPLLKQEKIKSWVSDFENILLICGRYEGIDQRIIDKYVDEEISIGDYILSGGEVAAQVVIDACLRLIPGVIGKEESLQEESIEWGLLEYPHYTRPEVFEDLPVPETLLSGNPKKIKAWRLEQALEKTRIRRPDLLDKFDKKKGS
ncbi:MAG: tRNA (guanosine(37)-N1)-methyltransferase TrmD [Deltaproteobacteria bacterium]|nr:tRNA (guanosine(37)-N1)-methyltransferase TrmD [Deltaproteobacteria bacterium]